MTKIVDKIQLSDTVAVFEVFSPLIAKSAKTSSYVVVAVAEKSTRLPFCISGVDEERGTFRFIVKKGGTADELFNLNVGDKIFGIVGPLGGNFDEDVDDVVVVTDEHGLAFASMLTERLIANGKKVQTFSNSKLAPLVINGVKPIMSMTANCNLAVVVGRVSFMQEKVKPFVDLGIKTLVSFTSVILDGRGLCGGCRLNVDGQTKFACVDGPVFDAKLVDFDSAKIREEYVVRSSGCFLRGTDK